MKVLATSRQPLALSWEYEMAVPPLPVPDLSGAADPVRLSHVPAVALFVDRARRVSRAFALTPDNARDVAELCVRLDGLPLAIELAAARTKLLSPQAMLRDVRPRLDLLARITANVSARHHTMRGAIGWSYELLSPDERALFRHLAVFSGGWTVDAAAAVWARSVEETWRVTESLAERSLVFPEAAPSGEPRFGMLEVLREFALEYCGAAGELDQATSRHLSWYLQLAEAARAHLTGPEQTAWLDRLARDHANIRAALARAAATEAGADHLVRFVDALWRFWNVRGHWQEGFRWAQAALAAAGFLEHPARGRVLHGAAVLAWRLGDYVAAARLAGEAEAACRALGDRHTAAHTLRTRAVVARDTGKMSEARSLGERSLRLFREIDDSHGVATSLRLLGLIDIERGFFDPAVFDESLRLSTALGDRRGMAWSTYGCAAVALSRGDTASAATLGATALRLFREVGDTNGIATALAHLARISRWRGERSKALALYEDSIALRRALGETSQVARLREEMGDLARGPAGAGLTAREMEVARLVCRGLSNRQIAEALTISERTAQTHVQHILLKLGVHARAGIAAWVARLESEPPAKASGSQIR